MLATSTPLDAVRASWLDSKLGTGINLFYFALVTGFLRFIGVANAAIWFGSAIFFTFAAGPAFFTTEMVHIIPPPYNGLAEAHGPGGMRNSNVHRFAE